MNKQIKILLRLLIANAAMVFCVAIASLLPSLWTGISGRDFHPQAFNASLLILVISCLIRYKFKWPILHMIVSLIPLQFITLICMAYFSGYTVYQLIFSFDLLHDFLHWLLIVDLFIGAPWIVGVFVGDFLLKRKSTE